MRFTSLLAAAGLLSRAVTGAALPTISVKGQYFFTSAGERWFVKGIAYQLSEADPLIDNTQCELDASLMQTLGTNAIRVYHVSAGSDHSACMTTFANAGIYLFVDLDTFNTQIDQVSPVWNSTQMTAFEAIMDEFQNYTNTAGFFIGNEVITTTPYSYAAPYIKTATAYMKAYRTSKGYRAIPIGYSHADIAQLRPSLQNYLACGTNSSESIEFFGLNSYEWCASNTYSGSGYETLTQQVEDYPIPIFFSETGCNTPEPRTFQDQSAIFGSEMTPYWSGAIIYEWIQETNHYGLITYGDDTNGLLTSAEPATAVTRSGTPTPVTPDFSNLMTAWATATPTGVSESAYTTSNTAPTCPSYNDTASSTWLVNGNIVLPTLNEAFNSQVLASITAGTAAETSATATSSGSSSSGSATAQTTTKATSTGGAARSLPTGGKELLGVSAGLGGLLVGAVVFL